MTEFNSDQKLEEKYPPRQSSDSKLKNKKNDKLEKNFQESNEFEVEDQNDHTNDDTSMLIDRDGSFFKERREKFKSSLKALLSRNKHNLTDLLTLETEENVTVKQPMKLHQILENQMKNEKLNTENRNPDAPNVDVDSGVSETMEPSENSNWDNLDDISNQDLLINTPQSPAIVSDVVPSFDQVTLVSICSQINEIDDHLSYFNTINTLILKKALESLVGLANEASLDRDNYLFLKTVRGALIHKTLGEKLEDQVLESMMNICQNIDELLHPQVEVLFDSNESFSFEEWSEIFIENHKDKKDESFCLLYAYDDFGNEILPQKREKSQPRLEPLDLKVIDKSKWTIDEPIKKTNKNQ